MPLILHVSRSFSLRSGIFTKGIEARTNWVYDNRDNIFNEKLRASYGLKKYFPDGAGRIIHHPRIIYYSLQTEGRARRIEGMEACRFNDFYDARLCDTIFSQESLQNERLQDRLKTQACCLRSGGLVPRSVLDHE